MADWYVAVAHRDAAITASRALEALTFEVYYPVERFIRRYRNQRITIEKNGLFRYMLVRGAEPCAIEAVRGIYRVLLDADGQPGIATQAEVNWLKAEEVRGAYDRTWTPLSRFVPGVIARVANGPLEGETGPVRRTDKDRVRVFLTRYKRVVNFPADVLALA